MYYYYSCIKQDFSKNKSSWRERIRILKENNIERCDNPSNKKGFIAFWKSYRQLNKEELRMYKLTLIDE